MSYRDIFLNEYQDWLLGRRADIPSAGGFMPKERQELHRLVASINPSKLIADYVRGELAREG